MVLLLEIHRFVFPARQDKILGSADVLVKGLPLARYAALDQNASPASITDYVGRNQKFWTKDPANGQGVRSRACYFLKEKPHRGS
jgi:hypothetical protein